MNTATKNIETTTFIKNVLEQIISRSILSKEEQEKLELLDNHLNFRNGKLNLKTMEFGKRSEADFVTEYLNYDFPTKTYYRFCQRKCTVKRKIYIKYVCVLRMESWFSPFLLSERTCPKILIFLSRFFDTPTLCEMTLSRTTGSRTTLNRTTYPYIKQK